jgi:hypothetical protein
VTDADEDERATAPTCFNTTITHRATTTPAGEPGTRTGSGPEQGPRIDPLDGGWLDRSGRGNPAHDGSRPGMLCRWRWTT